MAKVAIINPTKSPLTGGYRKTKRTLRERLGKHKHRPVFYSKLPGKLGERSEHAVLNKSKRSTTKMAAKRKTRKGGYKRRRKNPFVNPHKRRASRRRSPVFVRRRRRNPEGSLSMGSVGNAALGAGGAIVAYKMGTGLLGLEGNGKYIGGAIMTAVGYILLKKIWPSVAMPFGVAMGTLVIKDYLDESGLLSGLFGDGMTAEDVSVLQEFNNGLGMIPQSNMQTMPVQQFPLEGERRRGA